MIITQTPRILLRHVTLYDAAFILDLMNQPSYHQFIGDRGVRDIPEAMSYIQTRYIDAYAKLGYGLYAVELVDSSTLVGICGLVKRDSLPDPDLGFAFLPAYWSQGLAREAAVATQQYAKQGLGLNQLLAVTSQGNKASIRLLEAIGFSFQKLFQFPGEDESLKLFICDL